MLKHIQIKSFKSIEQLDLELGLVNIFIGANGSGKSNLLEAIGVLGAAARGRVDDEALIRRGVRPGLPFLYKTSLKNYRPPNQIGLEASNENALFAVGLFNPLKKPEPSWRFHTEKLEERKKRIVGRSHNSKLALNPSAGYAALKAVELKEDSPASKLLKILGEFSIYSPDTATLRGLRIDAQSRAPLGLNGGRLAEAVEDMLRRLPKKRQEDIEETLVELIDWADSVKATGPESVPISKTVPQPTLVLRFEDKYMAEKRNHLSGYDASEGALYVLFMMVLVLHPEAPSVLAVDNFDQALNPRLAKALTKKTCDWITKANNRQLLLTSHNPLVLDGLPLRNDNIRLFTVERSRKGKTIVNRVMVDEKLMEAAEKGVPLSQQWVTGTFGGVPNI